MPRLKPEEPPIDEIEKDFLDAVDRLKERKPQSSKLKSKLKKTGDVKVNISNVAIEAGRARTLIALADGCRYPRVRQLILLAKEGRDTPPTTHTELIKRLRFDKAELDAQVKKYKAEALVHFNARIKSEKEANRERDAASRLRKEIAKLGKVAQLVPRNAGASDAKHTEAAGARLLLIRGLPGSGKSMIARAFAGSGYAHFETDMYMTDEHGEYRFDEDALQDAHLWCLGETRKTLKAGKSVVVANVFATEKDIRPYVDLGYPYEIIETTGRGKSAHGVPPKKVELMRSKWVARWQLLRDLSAPGDN